MDLFYFGTRKGMAEKDLLTILQSQVPAANVHVCNDIESFSGKLTETNKKTIAVMLAADEDDLIDLYAVKHLFYRVTPVLILPDEERDTIALGFRCKPFYMTSLRRDLAKIGYVVHLLMAQTEEQDGFDGSENHKRAA